MLIKLRKPARRRRGGEFREGREVNGVQAHVVPKGTIRKVIRKHQKLGDITSRDLLGDDTQAAEALHRTNKEREVADVPGAPRNWTTERGQMHLNDLLSGRMPRE